MSRPWQEQAVNALTIAFDDRWEEACKVTAAVLEEHGGDVITSIMLVWIDTTLLSTGVGVCRDDRIVAPLFLHPETGQVGDVDAAPPGVQFAGRLLAARAAGDKDTALALVSSLKSGEELVDSMFAVLNVCSSTLRWAAGLPVG